MQQALMKQTVTGYCRHQVSLAWVVWWANHMQSISSWFLLQTNKATWNDFEISLTVISYSLLDILVYYSVQCKCNCLIVMICVVFHRDKQINISLKDNYTLSYINRNEVSSVFIRDSLRLWHERARGQGDEAQMPKSSPWLAFSMSRLRTLAL